MKRIVVPIDFSKLSRSAALYAMDLAATTNASVMFVSVIEIQQPSSQLRNWNKLQREMEKDAEKESAKFMKELAGYSNSVKISYKTLLGSPIEDIVVAFAIENKADLIVTGTKGASGLKASIFGSNSAALINKSRIPVLTVPGNIKFQGLTRVILATDMVDLDKQTKTVVKFVKPFGAQIDILHVTDTQRTPRDRKDLGGILSRMAGYEKISITVITRDDIIAGLDEFVQTKDPDLLIMFTHKLSMFERLFVTGFSRKMAFHTEVPLLTIKKRT